MTERTGTDGRRGIGKRPAWLLFGWCAVAVSVVLAVRLRASVGATTAASIDHGPIRELLYAVPFRVDKPFVHAWRKERPLVSAGYLLVLSVDPQYVRPRETPEPVLYAGDQSLERVNHGFESGRVVAILPAAPDADGGVALDLAHTPFWFGAPDLPERVDASEVSRQRAAAGADKLREFTADEVAAARRRGGEMLRCARREDLEARAGLLVLEHSPEEHELGEELLMPSGK